MQQAEARRVIARADKELDRDIDEAKADRPFPQRTSHSFNLL
jgi:hypothetical protein